MIVFLPSVSADDYLEDRPVHYYEPATRFPTLYLLHGSYGDCMDWCLRTGIERYAQEKGVAVVMPSGENSSYVNMAHGEAYLDYIGRELPAFTRKIFPLSRKREETWLAGLSMGGYGAFRVGLEYPETFGRLAALSGALDMQALQNSQEAHATKMPASYKNAVFADYRQVAGTRDDLAVLLAQQLAAGRPIPPLFMTCGTEDFILPGNEAFYRKAAQLGVTPVFEKHPGVHNWEYWDGHIRDVLAWLTGETTN